MSLLLNNSKPFRFIKPCWSFLRPSIRTLNTSSIVKNQLHEKINEQKVKSSVLKSSTKPIEIPIKPEPETKPEKSLKEEVYTLPNILTMTRIAAAPLVGYYIVNGESIAAISLFSYSCITDFLDGFIARKFNMKTVLGTIIDPIADKLLMGISTIALYIGNIMPEYLALIIIGKDAMLAAMGIYYRITTLPAPKTFKRLINLSIPTVKVEPNLLSKINTGLQMIYIGSLVFKSQIEVLMNNDYYTSIVGNYEIALSITTIISGLSYLVTSRSIKGLK